MMPWFIWKDEKSSDLGLWISKLPKITRANEKYSTIDIPGRAGSLIMLEGTDVYESYLKECKIQTVNTNPRLQQILNWLRGEGEAIFSNEQDKVYHGRIASQVEFDRISNDLIQATVQFFVEPFKRSLYPDYDQKTVSSSSATIYNTGDVASKPLITITKSGNSTVNLTIGGQRMSFKHVDGTIIVDCDARLITRQAAAYNSSAYYYKNDYAIFTESSVQKLYRFTDSGTGATLVTNGKREEITGWDSGTFMYIWPGEFSGEFISIQPGEAAISLSTGTAVIEPRWRWV